MAAKASPDTVITQSIKGKGILAGSEVSVDREEAGKMGFDVTIQPKSGRGSPRLSDTVSFREMMVKANEKCPAIERKKDDLAALIYTSGTTGLPKGVMLTHGNFLAQCEVAEYMIKTGSDDRFSSLVPFFHVFGLADGLIVPMHRGCASVVFAQYAPRRFLDCIDPYRISVILAIPNQYQHILSVARRRNRRFNVKYCIFGASPLQEKTIAEFIELFQATIIEGYGMTETTSAVTLNPPQRIKPGSIGLPSQLVEMKVVSDNGEELPHGEHGEILIRGQMVTSGYYNLPEESKESFSDDWLKTGDIGYKDEEGYFFITDRKKDIILKGGYNISPREIEDILCTHPSVLEAMALGIPTDQGKEEIRAFCVPIENSTVTVKELTKHCRKHLASYKTPDTIQFVEKIPKTATGKMLRTAMRDDYKDNRLIERSN